MKAGVTNIFGLHGAHLETIFQSCLDHKIPITDTRHEVAAGHAAEGYARSTRGLGVAMITAGPGFTNVITSMANAYLDRTPVLYITGSSALAEAETNTLQSGLDQVAIATPITKWAQRITVAQTIPRLVAQAVRIATSAPTGPVLLDIPLDVLGAQVDEESVAIPERVLLDSPAPPQARAVDETIQLLKGAARPVIMAGVGAYFSDAGEELRAFAEAAGIPVFSDFQAHGLLPSNHPLYGGTYHKMADLSAADQRPDVVLAMGVRFGLFTLGMSDLVVPLAAKIIHVEVDAKEIGRLRQVAVGIVADPRETLRALNARAKSEKWPDRSKWQQTVRNAKVERCKRAQEDLNRAGPPIHPLQAVSAIVENMPEDTIVIGDGAEAYHWMNEVIHQNRPGGYITHGFLGAVGFGLGSVARRAGGESEAAGAMPGRRRRDRIHDRGIRHDGAAQAADRRRGDEQSQLGGVAAFSGDCLGKESVVGNGASRRELSRSRGGVRLPRAARHGHQGSGAGDQGGVCERQTRVHQRVN